MPAYLVELEFEGAEFWWAYFNTGTNSLRSIIWRTEDEAFKQHMGRRKCFCDPRGDRCLVHDHARGIWWLSRACRSCLAVTGDRNCRLFGIDENGREVKKDE